ncbi:MAG TPA: sigma-54 dependent transcriptional regulator, partial [Gemmatimonadaceae bacterium]
MTERGYWAGLLGESDAMQRLRAMIRKVAPTNLPVLIQGPTGAGKELVAHALHELSGRRGVLVACNICALPDALFEDALFGHVRGAFSGATDQSAGLMLEADGGTLFLDEIGGLSIAMQAKLLRAIELKQFRPIGGPTERWSDFRVVAATHENLREGVAAGRFRLDLLQRIAAVPLHVPGLDGRVSDIPLLARHFAAQATPADAAPLEISDAALRYLKEQQWPGNVRQLQHVIACAVILTDHPILSRDDLASVMEALDGGETPAGPNAVERMQLIAVLDHHGWKKAVVAADLGVHRVTLSRWIKRLGISGPGVVKLHAEESHPRSISDG